MSGRAELAARLIRAALAALVIASSRANAWAPPRAGRS